MRIVGGERRGLKLAAPADDRVRPTSDRARQAIFNILASRIPPLPAGAAVLDMFAGTGALGLEALSRGAAQVTFVENGRESLALIERNLRAFGSPAQAQILRRDATRPGAAPRAFDLVFLDPPYGGGLIPPALAALANGGWLAPGALVIAETARGETLDPPGYALEQSRDYGAARFWFFSAYEN